MRQLARLAHFKMLSSFDVSFNASLSSHSQITSTRQQLALSFAMLAASRALLREIFAYQYSVFVFGSLFPREQV
jgi:hypothetical protein